MAEQEGLPLFVDDRVCQNMLLRSSSQAPSAAFGTDCLLVELLDADLIDERQVAASFLQLIEWRYRFLTIPSSILHILARDFALNQLRSVAKYVHDCMRDPGLFGGLEPTSTPMPIAFRYYQDWLEVIAKFVAEIWLDDTFSEERALEITRWAMEELVPTVPTVLAERIGRVANASAQIVLLHALMLLSETPDSSRANLALRTMASALGLGNDEFTRTTADLINCYG